MAKRKTAQKKKIDPVEVNEEELDRFAGSSESEPGSDHEDVQVDEDEEPNVPRNAVIAHSVEDENESDDDVAQYENDGPTGLASAMAKILGTQTTEGTVILSKTTTPLQRMAKKEKELAKAALEKRRMNREKKLEALHIPLSVATTRPLLQVEGSIGLVQELELERKHRRVATRGVVGLFNAIAQHQKKQEGVTAITKSVGPKSDVKTMTKHGFLDMIKSSATGKKATEGTSNYSSNKEESSSKPKWNALKDDFMMGSKLKDWDKESSEEEEDEAIEDNFDEEQPQVEAPKIKRQKV